MAVPLRLYSHPPSCLIAVSPFFLIRNKLQKSYFFLNGMPYTPLPHSAIPTLNGTAIKKRTFQIFAASLRKHVERSHKDVLEVGQILSLPPPPPPIILNKFFFIHNPKKMQNVLKRKNIQSSSGFIFLSFNSLELGGGGVSIADHGRFFHFF